MLATLIQSCTRQRPFGDSNNKQSRYRYQPTPGWEIASEFPPGYGTTYGKYRYIDPPVNRVGIKVYTVADIDSPDTGYRWATHEMGHYMALWIALVINRERQKTR